MEKSIHDQSPTLSQQTSMDSLNAISSPVSQDGPGRSLSPAGEPTAKSGRRRVHASRSPSLAKGRELLTSGIYGLTFIDSSERADLESSWVSRLAARLGSVGSTEWLLTWRRKATPSGRRIFRLAPSTRPTEGAGCIGWRSPGARILGGGEYQDPGKIAKRIEAGHQVNLAEEVRLAVSGWPTASARDWKDGRASQTTLDRNARPLNEVATQVAGWATPNASDGSGGKGPRKGVSMTGQMPDGSKATMDLSAQTKLVSGWTTPQSHDSAPGDPARWRRYGTLHGGANLNDEATMVGWPTPTTKDTPTMTQSKSGGPPQNLGATAREISGWATSTSLAKSTDHYNEAGNSAGLVKIREQMLDSGASLPSSDPTEKTNGGALNPEFVSWLMGFPPEWLNCAPSAMPSCRRSPRHSSPSSEK